MHALTNYYGCMRREHQSRLSIRSRLTCNATRLYASHSQSILGHLIVVEQALLRAHTQDLLQTIATTTLHEQADGV
jgi:hypothetical protein